MGFLQQRNRKCSSSSSSSSSSVIPLPLFLVFFITIFWEKSVSVVSAWEYYKGKPSNLTLENIQEYLSKINKPAVVTVKSPNGHIIDCVDIYKQPAFDHPLLKNHKLQLVPPPLPKGLRRKYHNMSNTVAAQVWKAGCPKGTVPIRRTTVEDVLRSESIEDFELIGRKSPNTALAALNATLSPDDDIDISNLPHEYATFQSYPSTVMYGSSAAINLWQPHVGNEGEMSISQLWLAAGNSVTNDLQTIEAGWHVYPKLYGDSRTHLFVYWTTDGYHSTGCYNQRCQGFMQIDPDTTVGTELTPISTKNGQQSEAIVHLFKDRNTGNWWLSYGPTGTPVGYWPPNLFSTLRESATVAQWGGEVTDRKLNGAHTSTEMGSNEFAEEGYEKASYFRQVSVLDSNYANSLPTDIFLKIDNANCYNLRAGYSLDFMGVHFFYGGPGNNPNCP